MPQVKFEPRPPQFVRTHLLYRIWTLEMIVISLHFGKANTFGDQVKGEVKYQDLNAVIKTVNKEHNSPKTYVLGYLCCSLYALHLITHTNM